jgi:hypothetical protein
MGRMDNALLDSYPVGEENGVRWDQEYRLYLPQGQ